MQWASAARALFSSFAMPGRSTDGALAQVQACPQDARDNPRRPHTYATCCRGWVRARTRCLTGRSCLRARVRHGRELEPAVRRAAIVNQSDTILDHATCTSAVRAIWAPSPLPGSALHSPTLTVTPPPCQGRALERHRACADRARASGYLRQRHDPGSHARPLPPEPDPRQRRSH